MGMKILAHVPLYPPSSRVGAWLATHACLVHMVQLGHQVNVIPYMADGWAYGLDDVQVHPRADLDDFDRPDIVLSHLGDGQHATAWAAERGIPSVRMVHGGHPNNAQRLAEHPTALAVFNSASLAAATGHPGPSMVVHPPFHPDDVRCTPGDMVTLVNLSGPKGGGVFFKLAKQMPDIQFLGVRGGYGQQRCGKGKNITVMPATVDMAADVYRRTRILLMPSEAETWGMVGLEAMVSGIPVIAHPTEGLRESLGDAGIFVDRDDITGWVDAIRSLSGNTRWSEASAKALAHASGYDPIADLTKFAEGIEAAALVTA